MGYERWKLERKHLKETGQPFPEERRHDRSLDAADAHGYWRQQNARTRADTPVAIWPEQGRTLVKFGNMRDPASDEAVEAFMSKGFLKCVAVTREEWSAALDAGKWADGKPIRMVTVEEQADVIPPTSTAEGGNAPEGDALWEQVKDSLAIGAATIGQIGVINSLDKANRLAGVVEQMRAAYKLGENKRREEKAPHDAAAKAVQEKWQPILDAGEKAAKAAVAAIQKFKDAEERRLREEARKREEAERQRLKEEAEAKLRAEAEAREKQAAQMGMEVQHQSEEEIAAQAEELAAEQLEQMPQADTSVRVGTAHGRAISKAKISKGRIVDVMAFFEAIKDHDLTQQFLQQRADALARAGANVPGVEFYKE